MIEIILYKGMLQMSGYKHHDHVLDGHIKTLARATQ